MSLSKKRKRVGNGLSINKTKKIKYIKKEEERYILNNKSFYTYILNL